MALRSNIRIGRAIPVLKPELIQRLHERKVLRTHLITALENDEFEIACRRWHGVRRCRLSK
jgi:hypothetical protein